MNWDGATLAAVVDDLRRRRGDSTAVEVKSAAGGCPRLAETICAFANMPEGGTIVLGLDESRGFAPSGLTDVAALEQGVASQARDSVVPPVQCDFQVMSIEGQDLVIAHVSGLPLADRPARVRGKAYLRQADGDYVMSEQEIAQIELQKTQAIHRTHPDRQVVEGVSPEDLDADLTRAYVAEARAGSRRLAQLAPDEILRRTGVTSAEGGVTLAGLYALGTYPQEQHPELSITAAVQLPDSAEGRTRDLVHLTGPLPELLDDAMEWVRRNTRSTMGYDERGHGYDRPEVPMRAVREVVANALVHRNLDGVTDSKRVEIRLRDDRLIVTSPGGLWGVSEDQLGQPDGKSAVNTTLYEICKRLRLGDGSRVIEGEGGGIREAMEALRSAGLRPLKFRDSGVRFTVQVSRHTLLGDDDIQWLAELGLMDELTSEQRAMLADMRHGGEWTNQRVRQEFPPTDSLVARQLLQDLVERELVEALGERGGTRYRLASVVAGSRVAQEVLPLLDEPNEVVRNVRESTPRAQVWQALATPMTFRELISHVGLTESQVRYALTSLREQGRVVMEGSRGQRYASYRRVEEGEDPSAGQDV